MSYISGFTLCISVWKSQAFNFVVMVAINANTLLFNRLVSKDVAQDGR